jgi:outer membrane protein insertion porin family
MPSRLLLFLLLLPVLALAQTVRRGPWPARLVAAQVQGSQHFAESDVLAYAGLKAGTEVTPEDLKAAADRLAASGAFEEVQFQYAPVRGGIRLQFHVQDAGELVPTSFDNFVWFSDGELLAAVHRRVPLFNNSVPLEGELLNEVTDALRGLLSEHGVAGDVRFTPHGEADQPPTSGSFSVEGVPIRIVGVEFPGAPLADVPALERAAQPLLHMQYDRAMLRSFAERDLRSVYDQRGHLQASFAEPVRRLVGNDPMAPAVALSIAVTPGPQYRLAGIHWSGNQVIQSYDLSQFIRLAPGAVADAVELRKGLDAVHTAYESRGYLRQATNVKANFNESERTVRYDLEVVEGGQYHMGSVEILGLEAPWRDRVRELWTLREGEPFDATYSARFVREAASILPPNAVTHMDPTIDENSRVVDVTIHYTFQQRLK